MRGTRFVVATALSLILAEQPLAQDATHRDDDLATDLRTALTLEGASCDAVTAYRSDDAAGYSVECRNGHRYRLARDDESLVIESLLSSPLRLARALLGHTPLLLHAGRGLLSVAGADCPEVDEIESDAAHGQLIGCTNGARFHVRVAPDGRVEVLRRE